jgi:hypothetical protein
MARVLRILALVFLALALPVQGMASVVAGQCMASGHHDDAAHSHGEDADAHEHDEGATSSHCGPCTACCASASIAAPVVLLIPASPSGAAFVFSQSPPRGVARHALYRPPLSS